MPTDDSPDHSKTSSMVLIHGVEVPVIEFEERRFLTFVSVDRIHGRPDGTARRNFNANREEFLEEEDFVQVFPVALSLHMEGVRNSFNPPHMVYSRHGCGNPTTLISESGYMLLVKSFQDKLAWQVQRELVKGYFRGMVLAAAPPLNLDDPRQLKSLLLDNLNKMIELEEKIALDAPKVEVYGKFLDSMDAISIDEFAKRMASIGYDIGETRAFEWLRWLSILLPSPKRIPYQAYIQNGDFIVQAVTFPRGQKTGISMQTRITSQGQIRLEKLMQQTYHTGLKGFLTWWDAKKKRMED